jgi:hypothetical protein
MQALPKYFTAVQYIESRTQFKVQHSTHKLVDTNTDKYKYLYIILGSIFVYRPYPNISKLCSILKVSCISKNVFTYEYKYL